MLQRKIHKILLNLDLSCSIHPVRYRGHGPNHWSVLRRTKFPKDRALEHFDDFYMNVYGERKWRSMRLALLSDKKYCAVINNYSDTDRIITHLEHQGAVNVRTVFKIQAEKLSEDGVTYSDPPRLESVYKLDTKLNKITAGIVEKDIKTFFPEVTDQSIKYLQSSNSSSEIAERVTNDDVEDDLKPVEESLPSLEATEENKKSRLISSVDELGNFVPASKLQGLETFVPESKHYGYYESTTDFPVFINEETGPLNFPEHLNIYTFDTGNTMSFDPPRRGSTNVFDYYLLDGASLFPVLALNLKPNDRVLDLCAAPGGKSVMVLQTMYPKFLTCNDASESRLKRLKKIMEDYFYDIDEMISISHCDGSILEEEPNFYNKILVDVPCTNDRLSLFENDNNIFHPNRIKERLQLPEQQAQLLVNALKLVARGGTVVYSTCSLSPIQNDGVVHMALRKIWEETDLQFVIKDLSKALEPTKILFPLENKYDLKYGFLITPYLPANFGPMYFCKLVRVK